jgi:hypothetical protein
MTYTERTDGCKSVGVSKFGSDSEKVSPMAHKLHDLSQAEVRLSERITALESRLIIVLKPIEMKPDSTCKPDQAEPCGLLQELEGFRRRIVVAADRLEVLLEALQI